MIVKIDHVALSSLNFEEDITVMKSLGYKPIFVEKDIKNLEIKRGLMRRFSKRQGLALLEQEGCLGVELINHGHINSQETSITPIFENVPVDLVEIATRKKINDNIFTEARIKSLNIPIYITTSAGSSEFRFNKLMIKTRDMKKALNFWECLGFKSVNVNENSAISEFKSPFDEAAYQIHIQENSAVENHRYLDDTGFNCIAFISNSVRNEKESLDKQGVKVTEIEDIELNGRTLSIFFAFGPSGELVELIGVKN